MEEIITASIKDFEQDLKELIYLYQDCQRKLLAFNKAIDVKRNTINDYIETKSLTQSYMKNLSKIIIEIEIDLVKVNNSKNKKELIYFINKKNKYTNYLRSNIGLYAALITSTDWQSPSFKHSIYSMAGRQNGNIKHTISDYKRDIHLDEKPYENKFLNEYVDILIKLPVHVYTVNSGMAAFITILNFLITDNKIRNKILIGKSIYFQNKEIIKKFFPDKIIEVDESDDNKIIEFIKQHKPSVIIFDTICNAINVSMPNLESILKYLANNIKEETYLIIDNTTLPIFFQPIKLIKGKNKKLNLFVLESLNKYHQFGMDRTTGGIILGYGKNAGKIYYARQNSGTNISDISIHMLPTPNKYFLSKRLLRFQRNTKFIAESLKDFIEKTHNAKFKRINYPALKDHPSTSWNITTLFQGSFFSLEFSSNRNIRTYRKFQDHVISTARKNKVQISAGTSFGFNNTRIYLTALRSDYTTPFIRVSVGTESMYEIEKIKEVFIKSMSTF